MSDNENPFKEKAPKAGGAKGESNVGWIAAGVMALLLVVVAVLWLSAVQKAGDLDSAKAKLTEANALVTAAQAEAKQCKDEVEGLKKKVAELEQEKEMVGWKAKNLEAEMRADLESKDVTISKLQGKLTVNILDRVMFDSGEAVLKQDGESVLRKIASILAGHPELKIHVIGHTDNLPIRNRYPSNWELSAARALAAVHFLTERAGVDPIRVGAVGYGEYRPIADNATPEGRSRNRRIAITILPDELAGADTAPQTKTNVPVDAEGQLPAPIVPAN